MKRDISLWQLGGFSFTALAGTLLHFLYDLTGESVLAAPFSGVNESTWEHMKLLYFPLLIFALIQSRFFKEHKDFWCIKLIGTVIGLAFIPMLFYTYNGAVGKSPDWLNIAIFFIAAGAAYTYELYAERRGKLPRISARGAALILFAVAIAFVIFTFITPPLEIFKDPTDGSYGIS